MDFVLFSYFFWPSTFLNGDGFFLFSLISFDFQPFKVEKDMAQGVRVGTIGNDLEEEPMTQVGKFKKIKEKKAARVVAF